MVEEETDDRVWEILVVDDDPVCRQLLINRIMSVLPKANVVGCGDVKCVLDLFDDPELLLDIIFMDEYLGGSNTGTRLCKTVKNLFPTDIPLLVSVTSANIRQNTGVYDLYWSKPFPPERVVRESLLSAVGERSPVRSMQPEPDSDA